MRFVLYVDMDAFYVSVERRGRPELAGVPVIVGPDPRAHPNSRGVVLSASYEARPFGVKSAQPVRQALDRCPNATWVEPDFEKYVRASRDVRHLLEREFGEVAAHSIDEFALVIDTPDATHAREVALRIQRRLSESFELPASIGGAPQRVVAKIASDRAKPGGVVIVPADEVARFLAPLSVGAIPGVGPKSREVLASHGIESIGQLAAGPPVGLQRALGGWVRSLVVLARGDASDPAHEAEGNHSRQVDRTFEHDLADFGPLARRFEELARELSESIAREGAWYQTITIGLKWVDFTRTSRSRTLPVPSTSTDPILRDGARLLRDLWEAEQAGRRRAVRTMSVGVERLRDTGDGQATLDKFGPVAA